LLRLGKCHYANGDEYEGNWKNDLREGIGNLLYNSLGTLIKENGDKYEGEWKEDQMTGKGKKEE